MRWQVEHRWGRASELLATGEPQSRLIRLFDVTGPALVLGSSQPDSDVDAAAASAGGIEVVRRRSGGGAVLVAPRETLWVDVFVPTGDPLWSPDVGVAFHWLGRAWTAALAEVGVEGRWHDGPMVSSSWSRTVCFAGVGPGEVLAGRKGKVVGMSQRRTRAHVHFQCCALLRWNPQALLDLLSPALSGGPSRSDLEPLGFEVGLHLEDRLRSAIVEAVASAAPPPPPEPAPASGRPG